MFLRLTVAAFLCLTLTTAQQAPVQQQTTQPVQQQTGTQTQTQTQTKTETQTETKTKTETTGDSKIDDVQKQITDQVDELLDENSEEIQEAITWFGENQWALGIILLILGPVVATQGLKMFPYVAAILASFFSMFIIVLLSATMGWADSSAGFWTTLAIAVVLGVLAGVLVRRNIWVTLGLIGAIGGFCGGILLLDVVTSLSGWTAPWALWVFAVVSALVGFFAACKLGAPIANMATSFIGSYLFTRSLTLFFWTEYWPSESQILSGQVDESLGWQFWVFVAILAVSTVGSIKYQATQKPAPELEDDNNFSRM